MDGQGGCEKLALASCIKDQLQTAFSHRSFFFVRDTFDFLAVTEMDEISVHGLKACLAWFGHRPEQKRRGQNAVGNYRTEAQDDIQVCSRQSGHGQQARQVAKHLSPELVYLGGQESKHGGNHS